MTEEQLKEIEERANDATPGPWLFQIDDTRLHDGRSYSWANSLLSTGTQFRPAASVIEGKDYFFEIEANDQSFIAHAREDIPKLIDALRASYAVIEKVEELIVRFGEGIPL